MNYNPVYAFIRTLIGIMTLNLYFKGDELGKTIRKRDGNRFSVFRHVIKRSNIKKEKNQLFFL